MGENLDAWNDDFGKEDYQDQFENGERNEAQKELNFEIEDMMANDVNIQPIDLFEDSELSSESSEEDEDTPFEYCVDSECERGDYHGPEDEEPSLSGDEYDDDEEDLDEDSEELDEDDDGDQNPAGEEKEFNIGDYIADLLEQDYDLVDNQASEAVDEVVNAGMTLEHDSNYYSGPSPLAWNGIDMDTSETASMRTLMNDIYHFII